MFVEILNEAQIREIIKKLKKEEKKLSTYADAEIYAYCDKGEKPCWHIIFGKKGKVEYVLNLSDTYLSSSNYSLDNIEHLSRVCFKELYNILGETYKDYYIEQVNKIFEPHSDKTAEYLDNREMVYVVPKILDIVIYSYCDFDNSTNVQVLFPDKGAHSRYADKIDGIFNVCVFTKKRNHFSNEIVQHELESGSVAKGSTCFILDDICSSGQTLLDVAKFAKMSGASRIYVVVAHCENRALEGELLKSSSPVDMMFTTKSMISCKHPKITYINENLLC